MKPRLGVCAESVWLRGLPGITGRPEVQLGDFLSAQSLWWRHSPSKLWGARALKAGYPLCAVTRRLIAATFRNCIICACPSKWWACLLALWKYAYKDTYLYTRQALNIDKLLIAIISRPAGVRLVALCMQSLLKAFRIILGGDPI